jgi:hypothetical protein
MRVEIATIKEGLSLVKKRVDDTNFPEFDKRILEVNSFRVTGCWLTISLLRSINY